MNDCPKAAERDFASLYLAGKLRGDEAEVFEKHLLACESCRMDVEMGSELRALFGKDSVVSVGRKDSPRRNWLGLAAAAAIAVAGVGVWQLARRTPEAPAVMRGTEGTIDGLKVSAHVDGGFDVSWPPPPRAASYKLEIFAPDGTRLWKTETRESRARIELSVLSPQVPGAAFDIRVQALDSLGQVVASGEASAAARP